jgi:hypothetical protein
LAWVGVWLWGAAAWSQEAPKGYKLGVLVPLSGKQEKLGEAILDAVNFAQVEHGALEVVIGDTRGTPEGAREQVEALALDPAVVAILGDVGWDTGRAGASRAQALCFGGGGGGVCGGGGGGPGGGGGRRGRKSWASRLSRSAQRRG